MSKDTSSLRIVEYALAYARRGWAVLPLHDLRHGTCTCRNEQCASQGKHPRTKNGVKDATTDPETIRAWWSKWPAANIGIATGSASGLYIIDIDTDKGATVEPSELCPNDFTGLLSESLSVRTGSGGYHIYLRYDPALNLRNTAGALGANIDTRGEGGYVVAPPSYNDHGPYAWLNGRKDVQPIPANLLSELQVSSVVPGPHKQPRQERDRQKQPSGREREVKTPNEISRIIAIVCNPEKSVAHEARNNFLIRMAGLLRRYGQNVDEARLDLLKINAERYGSGRHPKGPLSVEEMEDTIYKSVKKWDAQEADEDEEAIKGKDTMEKAQIPTTWIVRDLLSTGLIVLTGKPKMGKSWLTLGLALTCSLGSDAGELALGRYTAEPMDVLYLALEDGERRMQHRLNKLIHGRPMTGAFGWFPDWPPLQTGGIAKLDRYLLKYPQTKLVVIDTLACVRVAGQSGGNMYQEDYALMHQIKRLAEDHDVAIVLVHHTRKMGSDDPFDQISGSTGMRGAPDTNLILTRERGQHDAVLHVEARDDEKGTYDLALTFNAETCAWTCTGDVAERQTSQARQQILDLLRDHEAMTPAEIAKELGKPGHVIRKTLSRMAEERLVEKSAYGHYTCCKSQPELDLNWEVEDLDWADEDHAAD